MLRSRRSLLILIILALLKTGCGYSGDGEYNTEGIYPFRSYSLTFPAFRLDAAQPHAFEFQGYGGGKARVFLVVRSRTPISFFEVSTAIDIRISDTAGNTVFHKAGPLDAHYQRMVNAGEASWPSAQQWMADYEWEDEDLRARAVPFDADQEPLDQATCRFWSLEQAKIDRRRHVVEVTIKQVEPGYEGLVAEIKLLKGWK